MDSGTARQVKTGKLAWHYERRRPERTLLHRLVAEQDPDLWSHRDFQSRGIVAPSRARKGGPTNELPHELPGSRNPRRIRSIVTVHGVCIRQRADVP